MLTCRQSFAGGRRRRKRRSVLSLSRYANVPARGGGGGGGLLEIALTSRHYFVDRGNVGGARYRAKLTCRRGYVPAKYR